MPAERPKAVLVSVKLPEVDAADFDSSLEELTRLVTTLGYDVIRVITQQRSALSPGAVLGEGRLDRLVTPLVAAERLERRRDVDAEVLDAEVLGEELAAPPRIPRRVALGEEEAEDALLAEGADREAGAAGAVDAARHRDDDAAPADVLAQHEPHPVGDLLDLGGQVDVERLLEVQGHARSSVVGQGVIGAARSAAKRSAASRRLSLPLGVRGSASTKSTFLGTI